jgi:hypothetical protein
LGLGWKHERLRSKFLSCNQLCLIIQELIVELYHSIYNLIILTCFMNEKSKSPDTLKRFEALLIAFKFNLFLFDLCLEVGLIRRNVFNRRLCLLDFTLEEIAQQKLSMVTFLEQWRLTIAPKEGTQSR